MWQMILAKAIGDVQKGIAAQDAKRKQVAYNTEASLPIDNDAVNFGLNPTEEKRPQLLLAPKEVDDGETYY